MVPARFRVALSAAACATVAWSCGSGLLGTQYEYEEQIRLSVDGSARVDVSSSVPALVALRGVDLPLDPAAEVDRSKIRSLFEGPGATVASVRRSRRAGRQFVHVRVEVDDIRGLSRIAPFSWSTYQLNRRGDVLEYAQTVGASSGKGSSEAAWTGNEVVAFRMHIPSVIVFHNAPSRKVRRGNIVEWEQPLAERLKNTPVDIRVNMEAESILYTTLLLFGSTIVLAAIAFGVVIWRVARHGRRNPPKPAIPAAS
ncbi:MAG TPA: hypothetical protein VFO58_21620 [Vicinamibacterales bacterium]|nr:hypothetical protein [Vicinamibacterales bacterium]